MGQALKKEDDFDEVDDEKIGELTLTSAKEHGQLFESGKQSGSDISREGEIEIDEADLNTEGLTLDLDKEFLKDLLKEGSKVPLKAKSQKSEDDLDIDKENEHLKEIKQRKSTQGVRLGGGKKAIEEAIFENIGNYKNLVDEIAKDPLFTNSGDEYPQINGNYFLLDHLIDGGMAKICRARYLADSAAGGADKFVAIKMVQEKFSHDPEYVTMFLDEIKVSFGLQHSNISTTFDYGKIGDNLFVSMEYIHGKDLNLLVDRLALKKQVLPFEITLYIISKMCEGLFYAHNFSDQLTGQSYNIVHRDISPHNIMLSYEGDVKVIDFGIAKADTNEQEEQEGTVKGKINYFAPEYLEGKTVDHRYDQFAIGLTFWELLTGKKTFDEKGQMKTIKAIFDCHPRRPTQLNPKIPKEIENIVMKTLNRDPNDRYTDLSELNRDITTLLNKLAPGLNQQDLAIFMKNMWKNDYERDLKKFLTFGEYKIDEVKEKINKYKAYQEKLQDNPDERGSYVDLDLGFAVLETSLVDKQGASDKDIKKSKAKIKQDKLQAALMGMVKLAEIDERRNAKSSRVDKVSKRNYENVIIIAALLALGLFYFRNLSIGLPDQKEPPNVALKKKADKNSEEPSFESIESETIKALIDKKTPPVAVFNFKFSPASRAKLELEAADVSQTISLMLNGNASSNTKITDAETKKVVTEIEKQKLIESMRKELEEKIIKTNEISEREGSPIMDWVSNRKIYKLLFD